MDLFTREDLQETLTERQGPCVSIFIPTTRGGGEGDPTRWRRCLDVAEEGLVERGTRGADAREFLHPARRLLDDRAFWKGQCDGLAFFLAEGYQRGYRLPLTFAQRVAVGRRFLITPLLPLVSGNGRFHVLALSQNGVRLLQGTREAVSPVELKGVPGSLEEAMATHDVDEPLTFHTRPVGGAAGSFAPIYHGHGVGIDDHKDDLLRYFQQIDRGLRVLLRGERVPLVVAAVDYLQPIFRQACGYAGLLPEGLEGNPDRLSDQELHRRAWPLVEPVFAQGRVKALALYRQLDGTGRTARTVEELAPAACRGGVQFLFVAPDRPVWGQVDPASGRAERHESPAPGDEDLVNVAAACTLRHGGEVFAVRADQIPCGGDLAGILWLPMAKHPKGA